MKRISYLFLRFYWVALYLQAKIDELCGAVDSVGYDECAYDYMLTGDEDLAALTKETAVEDDQLKQQAGKDNNDHSTPSIGMILEFKVVLHRSHG